MDVGVELTLVNVNVCQFVLCCSASFMSCRKKQYGGCCCAELYCQLQHVSISPSLWISQSVKNAMQMKNTAKYIYIIIQSFFLYIYIPATVPMVLDTTVDVLSRLATMAVYFL